MSNPPTPHAHSGRPRNQETQAWSQVQSRLQAFLSLQSKSISNIKQVNMLQAQFNNETEPIASLQPKLEKAYHAALQDTVEQEKHVNQSIEALNALLAHRNVQANPETAPGANLEKRQKKRRLDGQDGPPGHPMSREGSRASPAPPHSAAMSQSASASGSGKRPPPSMGQMGRPNGPGSASGSQVPQTITVTTSMKPMQQQQKKLKRDGTPSAGPSGPALLAVGRTVAAKQPPEPGKSAEASEDYILAKVVKFHGGDIYTVQDVEADEGKAPAMFRVSMKDLVILPDPQDKSTYPAIDIPAGSPIMAVYPDTTSLYHGKVVGQPIGPKNKREEKDNVYRVIFDDDNNTVRPVPSHLVVKWKK